MKTVQQVCLWVGVVPLIVVGCFNPADGVFCVKHSDCESNTCDNGICLLTLMSGDGTDDSETEPSTDDSEIESDTGGYSEKMDAVDILFVVDNSASMAQEQEILSSSIFSLLNSLRNGVLGTSNYGENVLDVRVAVTNSDMGLYYGEGVYPDVFHQDQRCAGSGNNGKMLTEYLFPDDGSVSVPVKTEVITCSQGEGMCPPDWICTWIDENGNGVCTPRYAQTTIECPAISAFLTEDLYLTRAKNTVDEYGYTHFVAAAACLTKLGVRGCNFEAPLAAIPAAMQNFGQQVFLRKNAMTVIIVVTDEDDCSVGKEDWFYVPELGTTEINISCGKHPELLMNVVEIKDRILNAKTVATGVDAAGSVLLAAITGVPMGEECQGAANRIKGCLDVSLSKGGTMGNPKVVERLDPNGNNASYYEFACERFGEDGTANIQAYPGKRVVELAQLFGDLGFVYSICNDNWAPAMTEIGRMISSRLFL